MKCECLTCETSCHHCASQHASAHGAVSQGRMYARSGRQLWCQFSLIRGLFSDLLPGQARKEVTFSKVCLNGDDMWMCWHEAPLPASHQHHHPARRAIVLVFLSFVFFSPSPRCSSLPEKTGSLFVLTLVPIRSFIPKHQ